MEPLGDRPIFAPQSASNGRPALPRQVSREAPRYDGPGFDAELPHTIFEPKDFTYYEDAERQGYALLVYGIIIAAAAYLPLGGTAGPGLLGIEFVFIAFLIAAIGAPMLYMALGGEAALSGLASGLTLFTVALVIINNPGASMLALTIIFLQIAIAVSLIGFIVAWEARKDSIVPESRFPTQLIPSA